ANLQKVYFPSWWEFLVSTVAIGNRRLVSLSFALNARVNGYEPLGWHVVNIAIHLATALLVLAVGWRTLELSTYERLRKAAVPLGGVVAIFFAVHPLQTESVPYISQRAESLMGLLTLLSLYAMIRGFSSHRRWWWYALALLCADQALDTKPH